MIEFEKDLGPAKTIASSMEDITTIIKEASGMVRVQREIKQAIDLLLDAFKNNKRVFTMGEGRSGLVGRAFAMRLRHLDFHAHVIGESTTPKVSSEDVVLVISGSGETPTNISRVQTIIKDIKAKIIVITYDVKSTLGRLSDITVKLPGRQEDITGQNHDYEKRRLTGEPPLTPLGTAFEISAMIFLDSLIRALMPPTKTTEADMNQRHAIH